MTIENNEGAPSALESIAREVDERMGAKAIEGEGPGDEIAVVEEPGNAQLIAGMLELGRDVFCQFTNLSSPRAILQPAQIEPLANAWARVLDKRGISLHKYMGDYGEEVAAAVMTWAIGSNLYRCVNAEIMARDAFEKASDARNKARAEGAVEAAPAAVSDGG